MAVSVIAWTGEYEVPLSLAGVPRAGDEIDFELEEGSATYLVSGTVQKVAWHARANDEHDAWLLIEVTERERL